MINIYSLIKALLITFLLGLTSIQPTNGYFSDTEDLKISYVYSGCWQVPDVPALQYPGKKYTANPNSRWFEEEEMVWGDSSGCPGRRMYYYVEIYKDKDLKQLQMQSDKLIESKVKVKFKEDGTYYWRVRAFDGEHWSDWSEVWDFTIESKPKKEPEPTPVVETPTPTPTGSLMESMPIIIGQPSF